MWETLMAFVEQRIKTNGNKEITGILLQDTLKEIINNIGLSQFKGIATPAMTPPTFDGVCFYIGLNGYYEHFGSGLSITKPFGILLFDGATWSVVNVGLNSLTGNDSSTKINETDTPETLMLGYGSGSVFPTLRFDYMQIATPEGNYLVVSLLSETSKLGFQLAFKIGTNNMIIRNAVNNVWGTWNSINNGTEGKITLQGISTSQTIVMPANTRTTNVLLVKNSGTPTVSVYYDDDGTNRYIAENEEISREFSSIPTSEYFPASTSISIDISAGEIDFILEYKTQIV